MKSIFLILCLAPALALAQPSLTRSQEGSARVCYFMSEGQNLFEVGEYSASAKYFDEVINLDYDQKEAFEYRGNAKFFLRDYEQALLDFNRAIQLYENHQEQNKDQSFKGPHNIQLVMGDKVDYKLANLFNNRGATHFNMGNYREAYDDFTKSLRINSRLEEAKANKKIALALLKATGQGDPSEDGKTSKFKNIIAPKVTYNNPTIGNSNCLNATIEKIELKRNSTYVYFTLYNDDTEDIYISGNDGKDQEVYFLQDNNSKTYKFKKALNPNMKERKLFTITPQEKLRYILEFERIPDNLEYFHILENVSSTGEGCNYYDVRLK